MIKRIYNVHLFPGKKAFSISTLYMFLNSLSSCLSAKVGPVLPLHNNRENKTSEPEEEWKIKNLIVAE